MCNIHVMQNELEYDPALYQRDRGELDWDQRSISSTTYLGGDGQSPYPGKSGNYIPSPVTPRPLDYDAYLAHGPQPIEDIELSRFDSRVDQLPLLQRQQNYAMGDFYGEAPGASSASLPVYHSPDSDYQPYRDHDTMAPHVPPLPPMTRAPTSDGYREAPVHRPYPPSRQASAWTEGGRSDYGGNTTGSAYSRRGETY